MKPRWFSITEIPYNEMWQDDSCWLPKVIAGEKVTGTVVFADNNEDLLEVNMK